jgi:hypothetical protein
MKYPQCHSFWLEAETSPSVWDTAPIFKAGVSTLEEARERIRKLRGRAEPWEYRVVDPEGRPVEIETT